MNNALKKTLSQKLNKWWFIIGLAATACMLVPFLILGQDVVVNYHDQLDGEMIAYILQAKHLFQGNLLPEFMGGVSKTALTMPAPMCVLLFLGGDYFEAYVAMQLLGSLVGFVGMYLLAVKLTDQKWIAMVVGIMFAYLPFLPVYGLSQYGIPLLFWCFWQIKEGKNRVLSCSYFIFYGLNSSLVLVGFGILGMLLVIILWELWKKRDKDKTKIITMMIAWILLLITYSVINIRLLGEMLGMGDNQTSHKAEVVLNKSSFINEWTTAFLEGGAHSNDFHSMILVVALLVILLLWLQKSEKQWYKPIFVMLGWNAFFAFIAAFWNSSGGIFIRSHIDIFGSFQVQRVLWIAPVLWYLLLAYLLHVLVQTFSVEKGIMKILFGGGLGIGLITIAFIGLMEIKWSNIPANIYGIFGKEYNAISYQEYYAPDVMEQVKAYVAQNTGMETSQYRVASLGIDPAVAYYSGFYGLDGYSNNYPLSYKHQFRAIIEPELNRSDYLKDYFDNWGNRCYLFSSEIPGYYTIEKNGFFFQEYNINTDAFQELNGRFLLSAAYILNAEEQGLKLVREEPFETENSYYRIFLYEVE